MFWFKQKYTLDEVEAVFDMAFERACAMYEEARKANMVEMGLLPQEHLSREDMLKNRQRLQMEGSAALGRRLAGTPDDPDLTARDD